MRTDRTRTCRYSTCAHIEKSTECDLAHKYTVANTAHIMQELADLLDNCFREKPAAQQPTPPIPSREKAIYWTIVFAKNHQQIHHDWSTNNLERWCQRVMNNHNVSTPQVFKDQGRLIGQLILLDHTGMRTNTAHSCKSIDGFIGQLFSRRTISARAHAAHPFTRLGDLLDNCFCGIATQDVGAISYIPNPKHQSCRD